MKFSDEDLVRYADNTLSSERQQRLLDAAEHNAELAETLASLDASKLPFKAAFDQQHMPPVPESLRAEVANLVSVANSDNVSHLSAGRNNTLTPPSAWPRYLALAACLALCVGLGYGIGVTQHNATTDAADIAGLDTQSAWVERVADYQTLYVANTVADVEPDLPATLEKLDALAQATGVKTAVPDLSEAGYEFARAQELGFEGKTLVQVVYTKAGNSPLALCFMAANGESDESVLISSRHGLGTASWIQNNQRFVIVGNEPEETLKNLHRLASSDFTST